MKKKFGPKWGHHFQYSNESDFDWSVRMSMGKKIVYKNLKVVVQPNSGVEIAGAFWCKSCQCVFPADFWEENHFYCPGLGCISAGENAYPFRNDFKFGEYIPLYVLPGFLGFLDRCGAQESSHWAVPLLGD